MSGSGIPLSIAVVMPCGWQGMCECAVGPPSNEDISCHSGLQWLCVAGAIILQRAMIAARYHFGLVLMGCLMRDTSSLNQDDPNVCSHWERWGPGNSSEGIICCCFPHSVLFRLQVHTLEAKTAYMHTYVSGQNSENT